MTDDQQSDEQRYDGSDQVDAHVDGTLAPDEQAAFEALVEQDAELRGQVELSRRIDVSLGQHFAPPAVDEAWLATLAAGRQDSRLTQDTPAKGDSRRWFVAAAAMLMCAAAWSWVVGRQFFDHKRPRGEVYARQAMSEIYDRKVATGFEPKWVCEDDQEFADTFRERQGVPLRLAVLPVGTEMAGLDYLPALTNTTTAMLARVDGQPVIVFVDRADRVANPPVEPAVESGLRLFRTQLGELELYEITPMKKPGVMKYLEVVDDTDVHAAGAPNSDQ